jgi:SAM-dependent methyltransferase
MNNEEHRIPAMQRGELTARMEPFDTVPAGYIPADIESGYALYGRYLGANYLPYMPAAKDASILCVSCAVGYFVNRLTEEGYSNVLGIDANPDLVAHARRKGLNCIAAPALPFLEEHPEAFDTIWCGNEVNHLTKEELIDFLRLCMQSLKPNGTVIIHSQNGANPITGIDGLAHNIDHMSLYTEYSLHQVLEYTGFQDIQIAPIKLYVFYRNPLNYLGMAIELSLTTLFRLLFKFYQKNNRIFTKKIAGIGRKPS